jgi:hypothetical protein
MFLATEPEGNGDASTMCDRPTGSVRKARRAVPPTCPSNPNGSTPPGVGVPGMMFSTGDPLMWHLDLRHDNTGWRIWDFTPPPWCGTHSTDGYSACGHPDPAVIPSPTDDSPGTHLLESSLPCGPLDPFRQWHSCPPSDSPS